MQDQEKISIDVVLLLPEKINSICKELNKESDKTDYVSFEDGYNPHLTLGMGSILIKDIDLLAKSILPLPLFSSSDLEVIESTFP